MLKKFLLFQRMVFVGMAGIVLFGQALASSKSMEVKESDFDRLANFVIPFAKQQLDKSGEFYPFSASINNTGEVIASSAYDGKEKPSSKDLIELITEAFQNEVKKGNIRATAICSNVTVTPPGTRSAVDAISVRLEKVSDATEFFVPYQKVKGKFVYGESFASVATAEIFK